MSSPAYHVGRRPLHDDVMVAAGQIEKPDAHDVDTGER